MRRPWGRWQRTLRGCRRLTVAMVVGVAVAIFGFSGSTADAQTATGDGPKYLATHLNGFGIPFRVDANDPSYIEVQLYLSEDRGKTWRFHDRQSTDRSEFPFQASSDGEYWFALKTLNRNRQLLPEGKTFPELVIVVDTVKPKLSFNVEADPAGRIACRWRSFDAHLDPESLQILYQPVGAPPDAWERVPVNLQGTVRNGLYADQVSWWPETTSSSLNVLLKIADTAGNGVQQQRRINVAPSPWRHRSTGIARTGDAHSSGQVPPPSPPREMTEHQPRHPSNGQTISNPMVTCENGVCRVNSVRPSAVGSGSGAPENLSNPSVRDPNNRDVQDGQDAQDVQDGPVIAQRPASSDGRAVPRVAALGSESTRSLQVPLVGGKPEISAPPVPAGYVSPVRVAQATQRYPSMQPGARSSGNAAGQHVPWTSEPEQWTTRNRSTSSTTRSPDPRMLPNPYVNPHVKKSTLHEDLPTANPGSMTKSGDQVVGESSTQGPHNQYRGLKPQAHQRNSTPNSRFATGESHRPGGLDRIGAIVPELAAADQQNWQTEPVGSTNNSPPNPGYRPPANPISGVSNRRPAGRPANESQSNQNNWANRPGGQSVVGGSPRGSGVDDASLMMIGSKRFRLNYGIDAIDPSGVAKVDLWMTRNGGQTWSAWGSDPDNASPFPVEVQEEGRYGFRIVVHSKDGLTGRGPSSGDKADIWVEVDTQSPLAKIVSVPYGRGSEAGRLAINYRVADPFLVLRPISIAYSRQPDGPWTSIGEGLRNEGRFLWKPTSNVPDRIFLRLIARDRAGNVGVHELSQAIDVSGLVPRGTIHGVVPVGVSTGSR